MTRFFDNLFNPSDFGITSTTYDDYYSSGNLSKEKETETMLTREQKYLFADKFFKAMWNNLTVHSSDLKRIKNEVLKIHPNNPAKSKYIMKENKDHQVSCYFPSGAQLGRGKTGKIYFRVSANSKWEFFCTKEFAEAIAKMLTFSPMINNEVLEDIDWFGNYA